MPDLPSPMSKDITPSSERLRTGHRCVISTAWQRTAGGSGTWASADRAHFRMPWLGACYHRQCGSGECSWTEQVRVHQVAQLSVGDVLGGADDVESGFVDQDIEPAEALGGGRDQVGC